jgi:hypothetical protein
MLQQMVNQRRLNLRPQRGLRDHVPVVPVALGGAGKHARPAALCVHEWREPDQRAVVPHRQEHEPGGIAEMAQPRTDPGRRDERGGLGVVPQQPLPGFQRCGPQALLPELLHRKYGRRRPIAATCRGYPRRIVLGQVPE